MPVNRRWWVRRLKFGSVAMVLTFRDVTTSVMDVGVNFWVNYCYLFVICNTCGLLTV